MLVVENRVGGKLLCEKSLLLPALMSSFEVIYYMERDYAWCLFEVYLELFFSNEAISLALRTAREW